MWGTAALIIDLRVGIYGVVKHCGVGVCIWSVSRRWGRRCMSPLLLCYMGAVGDGTDVLVALSKYMCTVHVLVALGVP